ncbi:peptidoglycan-binding domain-containing protein [Alkalicoccobacillus gibsonii]|uniref:peptidoglycan-binding domain-containing protein n=1 Tax=Alkalicoccobacillus gibsonii TaxID=79881 RepID=UPI003517B5F1
MASVVYFYPDKGAKNNGIDGVYGPKTEDAVRRFQEVHGLADDGVYSPAQLQEPSCLKLLSSKTY